MMEDLKQFILLIIIGVIGIASCCVFLMNRIYAFLFFGLFMCMVLYALLMVIIMRRLKK